MLEAEGKRVEALTAYRDALADASGSRFPFPQAVAAADAGRLGLALDAADGTARTALEAATTTFRRLGAPTYLARAVRLLEQAAAAPTSAADPLALLTTRERQVAHALAAGMTNKEIAERLYVSVTTVNFHVRNILSKLGLRSRRDLRSLSRRRPVKS